MPTIFILKCKLGPKNIKARVRNYSGDSVFTSVNCICSLQGGICILCKKNPSKIIPVERCKYRARTMRCMFLDPFGANKIIKHTRTPHRTSHTKNQQHQSVSSHVLSCLRSDMKDKTSKTIKLKKNQF